MTPGCIRVRRVTTGQGFSPDSEAVVVEAPRPAERRNRCLSPRGPALRKGVAAHGDAGGETGKPFEAEQRIGERRWLERAQVNSGRAPAGNDQPLGGEGLILVGADLATRTGARARDVRQCPAATRYRLGGESGQREGLDATHEPPDDVSMRAPWPPSVSPTAVHAVLDEQETSNNWPSVPAGLSVLIGGACAVHVPEARRSASGWFCPNWR